LEVKGHQQRLSRLSRIKTLEEEIDHLEFFLKAGRSGQLFVDFLEMEYSVENIHFWKDVEEFREKNKKDNFHIAEDAKALFNKYISSSALHSVNISSDLQKKLKISLKTPSVTMFDSSQRAIYELMARDSFPRFRNKSAIMLQESWERVCQKKVPHKLEKSFYNILFTLWPAGEKMFPGGLKGVTKKGGKHHEMLITIVDSCINLLDDLKPLVSLVYQTATRHVRYGVKFEHFSIMGSAFLKFIETEDAANWNSRLETSWKNLYQILACLMITAMSEARSEETFKTIQPRLASQTHRNQYRDEKSSLLTNNPNCETVRSTFKGSIVSSRPESPKSESSMEYSRNSRDNESEILETRTQAHETINLTTDDPQTRILKEMRK